eukprot:6119381-Amphidinium_carterae.1
MSRSSRDRGGWGGGWGETCGWGARLVLAVQTLPPPHPPKVQEQGLASHCAPSSIEELSTSVKVAYKQHLKKVVEEEHRKFNETSTVLCGGRYGRFRLKSSVNEAQSPNCQYWDSDLRLDSKT